MIKIKLDSNASFMLKWSSAKVIYLSKSSGIILMYAFVILILI